MTVRSEQAEECVMLDVDRYEIQYPLTIESYKQLLASQTANSYSGNPELVRELINKASGIFEQDDFVKFEWTIGSPQKPLDILRFVNNDEILARFNSLSDESQELFISYLNNEELMKDVLDAFITGKGGIFVNGDILVSSGVTSGREIDFLEWGISNDSRNIYTRRIASYRYIELMGATLATVYNTLIVGQAQGYIGALECGFYGGVAPGGLITLLNQSCYDSNNLAYSEVDFNLSHPMLNGSAIWKIWTDMNTQAESFNSY